MSFGSKRTGSSILRENDQRGDALFESDWDQLVIRFDRESRSYRVQTTSATSTRESSDKEMQLEMAKVAAADV